jgi:hypothetical protein
MVYHGFDAYYYQLMLSMLELVEVLALYLLSLPLVAPHHH